MSNGFHEVEFDRGISYSSNFGPTFSTDVVTMPSKGEQRNINWSYPKHTGNLSMGIKKEADFKLLLNFFILRKGKGYGFRFYDWLDHSAEYQFLGFGDGSTCAFQLRKIYVDQELDLATYRKISKPIAGTVTAYLKTIADTTLSVPTIQKQIAEDPPTVVQSASIDLTTGILTLPTAPAVGQAVIASFDFDVPVRFDTDELPASYENYKNYGLDNIPVIELLL